MADSSTLGRGSVPVREVAPSGSVRAETAVPARETGAWELSGCVSPGPHVAFQWHSCIFIKPHDA